MVNNPVSSGRVSVQVVGLTGLVPARVGFRQRFFKSKGPKYASVKSVSARFAPLKDVPDSTALANTDLLRSDPSKLALSTTALVKSHPINLLFLAYAFEICPSLKLTPEKSA